MMYQLRRAFIRASRHPNWGSGHCYIFETWRHEIRLQTGGRRIIFHCGKKFSHVGMTRWDW